MRRAKEPRGDETPGAGALRWRDRPTQPAFRLLGTGDARLAVLDMVAVIAASRDQPLLLCAPDCRAAIAEHLDGAPVERGGLLIGAAWSLAPEDADEPPALLRVEEAVPAVEAQGTAISLRMDVALWGRAQAAAARRGGIIIGWYHSHPDLGAFFSRTDRRTQAAVFRHPYSLGLVVDPVRGQERWFLGPRCREIWPGWQSSLGRSSSEQQTQTEVES